MKSIFITAIVLLFVLPLCAQHRKHEITIGLGFASRPYLKEIIKVDKLGKTGYGGDDNSSTPAFSINYRYLLSSAFNIGATFVFEQQKHSLTGSIPPFENYSRYNDRYYTFLLNGNFVWVNRFINLYSGISAGINVRKRTETYTTYGVAMETMKLVFAYQITPVGIRVGKKIGAFAELGYGYKGILIGGLSYKF